MVWVVVFFQAEDGIRDLVRSRGLGDVYKRQWRSSASTAPRTRFSTIASLKREAMTAMRRSRAMTVSYTHLTLPTSDLV